MRGTDSHEQRNPPERCLSRTPFPRLPTLYNNFYQIFQTPDYVAIYSEMIHDARIVPLSGGPRLDPRIRQMYGDARGRWEEDTLVIQTSNFNDTLGYWFGWTERLNLTERFTSLGDGTIRYEFTLNDPTTYTSTWTMQVQLRPFEGPVYEYACHEGNRGLPAILATARAEEH